LPKADVLVFGRIMHNWDLPTKKMLLKKAFAALPSGGALIVYERLIDDARRTNAPALLASLNMLIMTSGGFDFSRADCMEWMREVGFSDFRSAALTTEISMITGIKR
jgi:O-methyltransferase